VASIPGGGCWVLGEIQGLLRAGDGHSGESPDRDVILARILPSGKSDWLLRVGGPNDDRAGEVAALPEGGCLITGTFHESAHFEPWDVAAAGPGVFAAVYDADGNCISVVSGAEPSANPEVPAGPSIAPSLGGAVWIAGAFRERFAFAGHEVTAPGEGTFLARLASVHGS
jgi:hypothetical protein